MAMTADQVYKMTSDFFSARLDFLGGTKQRESTDVLRCLTEVNSAQCPNLLQIACMGNPERTIQGELVAYLRSHGVCAVQEVGHRHGWLGPRPLDHDLDILVIDGSNVVTVILLKHHSPHQGTIQSLCNGIDADYQKYRGTPSSLSAIPLIQIGLFTEIDSIVPWPAPTQLSDFEFHRLIYAHALKNGKIAGIKKSSILRNKQIFSRWASAAKGRYMAPCDLNTGTPEKFFVLGSKYTIKGVVHWCLLMA